MAPAFKLHNDVLIKCDEADMQRSNKRLLCGYVLKGDDSCSAACDANGLTAAPTIITQKQDRKNPEVRGEDTQMYLNDEYCRCVR